MIVDICLMKLLLLNKNIVIGVLLDVNIPAYLLRTHKERERERESESCLLD